MNNKLLIENYMEELWNKKNINVIDNLFMDDTLIHSPLKISHGKNEMQLIAQRWLSAFPDLVCQWEDWIIEKDKIVSRWSALGTHLGNFLNHLPTGKIIKYTGVSIYKLKNMKILEYWGLVDMHGIINQIQGKN